MGGTPVLERVWLWRESSFFQTSASGKTPDLTEVRVRVGLGDRFARRKHVGSGASSVLAECESVCSEDAGGDYERRLGQDFSWGVGSALRCSASVLPETVCDGPSSAKNQFTRGSLLPLNINTVNLPRHLRTEEFPKTDVLGALKAGK